MSHVSSPASRKNAARRRFIGASAHALEVIPIDSLPDEPWTKIPEETALAFSAFVIYREMGAERAFIRAEEVYRKRRGLKPPYNGQVSAQFNGWIRRFRWKERAQAYDKYMDEQDVAVLRKKRVEVLKRQAEENADISQVLMTPIRMFKERLEKFVSGEMKNGLEEMTDEDLLRLGKFTAQTLASIHKNEREVLGVKDDSDIPQVDLTIRAEAVRAAMQSPDTIAMLEKFTAEVTTKMSEGQKPRVLPEPANEPEEAAG